jgi:hypothetical protein
MAAGTAFARVLQSDDAYRRTEVKSPGKLFMVLKAFSQSDSAQQAPEGRFALTLNPR